MCPGRICTLVPWALDFFRRNGSRFSSNFMNERPLCAVLVLLCFISPRCAVEGRCETLKRLMKSAGDKFHFRMNVCKIRIGSGNSMYDTSLWTFPINVLQIQKEIDLTIDLPHCVRLKFNVATSSNSPWWSKLLWRKSDKGRRKDIASVLSCNFLSSATVLTRNSAASGWHDKNFMR